MPHFFGRREGDLVFIEGGDAAHLARSLRVQPGEKVRVVEPAGKLLEVRVISVSPVLVQGEVVAEREHRPEPVAQVTIALSMLPGTALEEALSRCTELGAAAFLLVRAERSVGRGEKLERWRTICREAAMLAGRLVVPEVAGPIPFAQAWPGAKAPLLLDGGAITRLASLPGPASVTLFIGPEGGWSPAELALAGQSVASLGPRNLRAENAAAAALTVALAARGDL